MSTLLGTVVIDTFTVLLLLQKKLNASLRNTECDHQLVKVKPLQLLNNADLKRILKAIKTFELAKSDPKCACVEHTMLATRLVNE